MKITQDILSLPPYISTAWKNIASLHMENQSSEDVLVVTLLNGARIEIPSLEAPLLEMIFATHIRYLEQESAPKEKTSNSASFFANASPVATENPFLLFGGVNPLIHDASQANTPLLPSEILEKIGELARAMDISEQEELPQPEEDCNCIKCQIARAIRTQMQTSEAPQAEQEDIEEEVTEADLSFASWQVSKKQEHLYVVTNPLEQNEQYLVHLANPIGCTCGKNNCEHIQAVLKT